MKTTPLTCQYNYTAATIHLTTSFDVGGLPLMNGGEEISIIYIYIYLVEINYRVITMARKSYGRIRMVVSKRQRHRHQFS